MAENKTLLLTDRHVPPVPIYLPGLSRSNTDALYPLSRIMHPICLMQSPPQLHGVYSKLCSIKDSPGLRVPRFTIYHVTVVEADWAHDPGKG